jgi:serine/threonine-protein kinase
MQQGDIGGYRLIRKIGQGAMAEVYLARHLESARDVALKLLNPALTRNEDLVRRFQQEARWASLLRHPNILSIHEVGEEDGRHYIAAEFVDGETLRERMNRGRVGLVEMADIVSAVSAALETAHREWIVHRDIKPENVMIGRTGEVKVLDFGLAKLARPSGTSRFGTQPGTVVGTLQYVAPEQALGAGIDPRTDIFSLGVVMYEMIAGVPPFRGESLRLLLRQILDTDPPPLMREGVNLPRLLIDLVNRALRKDPEERPGQVGEIAATLSAIRPQLADAERDG